MSSPALELSGVDARYGTAHVLFDVTLQVGEREVVGLLGRNGAGKTTLLRSVMGLEARRSGSVQVHGTEVSGKRTDAIARMGVGWVPDDRRLFPDLSVTENITVATRGAGDGVLAELTDAFPLLEKLLDRQGGELSGGEQQVVAIARALASRPRLLLLDEASEGLAPVVVEQLKRAIVELPERFGVSILMADENLSVALELSSRLYVLEAGYVVHAGTAEAFAGQEDLQRRYLAVSTS